MTPRTSSRWRLAALVTLLGACSEPGDSEPSNAPPQPLDPRLGFDEDVHPILVASCGDSGCHDVETVATPGHGAPDADQAFAAVQGMSRGEPVYRRILARASGEDPDGFMPPPYAGCEGPLGTGECLELVELERIRSWVEQGATQR